MEAANIQGLQNILELAVGGHCYFWHHMGTAYVAGKREGLCREEIAETARHTNVYEETKYRGERMVADFCARHGIRLNIFRPSIVYGHSGNGRSSIFRGLYYPVRVVAYLKSLYELDIRENGGQRAAAMGVRSTADGSIYLPLRLEVNENGGINLIPIDYLVRAFMAIMEESLEGGIFHVVSPNLQKIFALIDYTQRFFQIEGIGFSSANDSQPEEKNPLAVLFDRYLEAYTPYIRDRRLFDDRNARAILESKRILCPEFTYEIFARIMKFAVECNWGAKLFLPPPNPEV